MFFNKRKEEILDVSLQSQIGEEQGPKEILGMLARENKLAIFSFFVIVLFILAAIFAPYITPYSYSQMDLLHRLSPPSSAHLFGTDEGGRDILTRMLYGSRVSLLVGVVPTIASMMLGTALGVISGYVGGVMDAVIMRIA
ncbi:MAG: ABC transporter permease, partial [Aeriscardovia sp.]|nr:ABC transporter permease [Aeriscardovia sp.]